MALGFAPDPNSLSRAGRKFLIDWADWIALFFLAYILLFVAVMHDAELRYLGASLWVGGGARARVRDRLPACHLPRRSKAAEVILILALLGISKLPTHFLWKFFRSPPELRTHSSTLPGRPRPGLGRTREIN